MRASWLGRILTAILFLSAVATCAGAQSAGGADTAAIKDVVAQLAGAFNRHDGMAYSTLFSDDGEFTNIRGITTRGQKAIGGFMTQLFSGPIKDATGTYTVRGIQMLGPMLAAVDVDTTVQLTPSGPPFKGMQNMILTKQTGYWQTLIFHEMVYPPPPPPPGR